MNKKLPISVIKKPNPILIVFKHGCKEFFTLKNGLLFSLFFILSLFLIIIVPKYIMDISSGKTYHSTPEILSLTEIFELHIAFYSLICVLFVQSSTNVTKTILSLTRQYSRKEFFIGKIFSQAIMLAIPAFTIMFLYVIANFVCPIVSFGGGHSVNYFNPNGGFLTVAATIVPFLLCNLFVIFMNLILFWSGKRWLLLCTTFLPIMFLLIINDQINWRLLSITRYYINVTLIVPSVSLSFVCILSGTIFSFQIKKLAIRI